MNTRIKEVRLHTSLSQEDFGYRLSVTRNVIASYELSRVEPTELFIKHLCREFNVNEEWLQTGKGKMFLEKTVDEEFSEILGEILVTGNERTMSILKEISKLEDHESELILGLLKTINSNKQKATQSK
ncbi:helix-turn-helix transcriptional regulator [Lysinibacillus sphaericus]|uniref:helix-turn-helix transcriptional regulator n=1 Tax=Lysinibacillus sphaericus TaxID=1421 RepID=UPI003D087C2D